MLRVVVAITITIIISDVWILTFDRTIYRQEAEIDATAPVFKSHFEQHGVSRLQQQAVKGLEVMEELCEMVAQEVNSIGDLVQHEMEHLSHLFEPAAAESHREDTPSPSPKPSSTSSS